MNQSESERAIAFRAPAEGERRAVRGFEAQYRLAALRVVRALENGILDAVYLVDPSLGRVDDVVVASPSEVTGAQVKYGEYSDTLSIRDLLRADGGTPSLFQQLADGWSRLRTRFPGRGVRVELIHHGTLSSNNQARVDEAPNGAPHGHTEALYRLAWLPDVPPADWKPALDFLRIELGLDPSTFEAFRRACRFTQVTPEQLGLAPGATNLGDDTLELANYFRARVAQSTTGSAVRIDRAQILADLGWESRYKTRYRHEFPIDAVRYVPNQEALNRVRALLMPGRHGYVALLGAPGAGKSTLLTQVARDETIGRVVRYYAYVPQSQAGRADALPFLNDLVTGINQLGLPERLATDVGPAKLQLAQALARAAERFNKDGERTVILVDGLDHAERDGASPNLLEVLPPPSDIPPGVLVVLGSQTLELSKLNPQVRDTLTQDASRHAVVPPLSRQEALELALRILDRPLDEDSFESLYVRTAGHPLTMHFALAAIASSANGISVDSALAERNLEGSDVRRVYMHRWEETRNDPQLLELLATIARLRDPVRLDRLLLWFGDIATRAFRNRYGFLFRPLSDGRWLFQHDSWRQFLLRETALNGLDEYDQKREQVWHRGIADRAASAEDEFRDEEMHHRALAGDSERVIELARPERLRAQFLNQRPVKRLREDLDTALRAAGRCRNRPAIAQILLLQGELRVRQDALDEVDLVELTYVVQGPAALRSLLDTGALADYAPHRAMGLVARIAGDGDGCLAAEIFDACQPLARIYGLATGTSHDDWTLLRTWARVAWRYLAPQELLTQIKRALSHAEVQGKEHWRARERLLWAEAAYGAIQANEPDKQHAILQAIDENERSALAQRLRWWRLEDDSLCPEDIRALIEGNLEPLEPGDAALLADRVWRRLGNREQSLRFLDRSLGFRVAERKSQLGNLAESRLALLRAWRTRAALDADWVPTNSLIKTLVEESRPDNRKEIETQLRLIALLARTWGSALRSTRLVPEEVVRQLKPVWRHLAEPTPRYSDAHASFRQDGARLIYWILSCAMEHGTEAGNAVALALLDEDRGPAWLLEWSLLVVESDALAESNDTRLRWCDRLETTLGNFESLQDRLKEHTQLALVRSRLGDRDGAERCRRAALEHSFGMVYDKDYTPVEAAGLLLEIATRDRENAPKRLQSFAVALARAQSVRNVGRGFHEAWSVVARAAALVSPSLGLSMWQAFHRDVRVPVAPALEGLLVGLAAGRPTDVLLAAAIAEVLTSLQGEVDSKVARVLTSLDMTADQKRSLAARLPMHASPDVARGYQVALGIVETHLGTTDEFDPEVIVRGQPVKQSELLALAVEIDNFLGFVADAEMASAGERYTWDRVLRRALEHARPEHIRPLAEIARRFTYPPKSSAALALKLAECGEKGAAIATIQSALSAQTDGSWSAWADGAPRLVLFKALVEIDPSQRDLALDDFLESRLNRQRYALMSSVLDMLAEVQFALGLDAGQLWDAMSQYLGMLWPFHLDEQQVAKCSQEEQIPADRALAIMLRTLALSPQPRMAARARAALALGAQDSVALGVIMRELARGEWADDREAIAALQTLEMVRERVGATLPQQVLDDLERKRLHASLSVRELVARLLNTSLPIDRRDLSPIYSLALPELSAPVRLPLEAHERLSDLEDDASLLQSIFGEAIDSLSAESGIPPTNIVHRAIQLYEQSGGRGRYGRDAEAAYARLPIPFIRPRTDALRNALARLVAELLDGGRLQCPLPQTVRDVVARNDVRFLLSDAVLPDGLPGSELANRLVGEAIAPVFNQNSCMRSDGSVVVAAHAETTGYGHNWERVLTFVRDDLASYLVNDQRTVWADCGGARYDRYPLADDGNLMPALGVRVCSGPLDAERDSVFALSPVVGAQLGWVQKPGMRFQWHDGDGALVAGTIVWATGDALVRNRSRTIGSAVVVTGMGWAAIRQRVLTAGLIVLGDTATKEQGAESTTSVMTIGGWGEQGSVWWKGAK